MCTDIELAEYHDWVDRAEAAHYQSTKAEISHNEYISHIIHTIELNTPIKGLGTNEIEDLLLLEPEQIKKEINQWLVDDYLPTMNENQWKEVLKSLAK